uniref:Transposase n=1 Tax=Ditylenchus dipsaci TaxID=166011 RepID=A0A915CYD7_9BILA
MESVKEELTQKLKKNTTSGMCRKTYTKLLSWSAMAQPVWRQSRFSHNSKIYIWRKFGHQFEHHDEKPVLNYTAYAGTTVT